MKYYLGMDVGGMSIKVGLVSIDGKIVLKDSVPTGVGRNYSEIIDDMAALCHKVVKSAGISDSDVCGLGIGIPGLADSETGVAVYVTNMFWRNVPLVAELQKRLPYAVKINNDANVAALAEAKFGSGKNAKNAVLLTLGTGVGGGIILNGNIFEGNGSAGAELGHIVINVNGQQCNCGRKGCLETYASATALIRETKKAILNNPNSMMNDFVGGDLEKVNGITAFKCAKSGDETAQRVVSEYINYIGEGVVNFINVFRPDVVMIGGGISAEGEYLLKPLRQFVDKYSYAGEFAPKVEIVCASLGNDAGIIGAAALFM